MRANKGDSQYFTEVPDTACFLVNGVFSSGMIAAVLGERDAVLVDHDEAGHGSDTWAEASDCHGAAIGLFGCAPELYERALDHLLRSTEVRLELVPARPQRTLAVAGRSTGRDTRWKMRVYRDLGLNPGDPLDIRPFWVDRG